ncbi:MAG: TonB-dependent receptor [Pseudomonadota bacterium]
MKPTNVSAWLGACSIFVFSLAAAQVAAQSDTADADVDTDDVELPQDTVLEEVIVTGTKQGLSLQNVTDSVEIFTAERLENETLFGVSEALSRAANVSVIGANLNTISIRGISRNGTGGAGQGQAINIYVDGAPASTQALFGFDSVWDLQQIEVLRGSQSTVQGRNAIAGAVILKSNSPTYFWENAARLRFADFGTRQYAGMLSGPILDDQLAFRLSADFQETDGYVTDGFRDEPVDELETLSLRGKLLWEPAAIDALSTQLTLEYIERETGNSPFVLSPGPPNEPEFLDFDPIERVSFPRFAFSSDIETTRIIGELSYAFSDSTSLELLGTYEEVLTENLSQDRLVSSFTELGFDTEIDNLTYTAEARLEFNFDRWSGLVGAYYFLNETETRSQESLLLAASFPFPVMPPDSAARATSRIRTDTDNTALFTSWRYEPNARWAIDLGLRYDAEDFTTEQDEFAVEILPPDCTATIPGNLLGLPVDFVTLLCSVGAELLFPPPGPLQSDDFDAFLPRAAVTYFFNDDVNVFAGVRRGYRAGGTFLATSVFGSQFQVVAFDPEFLISYEAGWRSVLMDGRLTFNGTVYYSDYEDQQINVLDDEGFSITVNAGETSLYGLELSADFLLNSEWELFANLGLQETSIDEFPFDDFGDTPINLAGNELPQAPSVTGTAGVVYENEHGVFGSASLNYRSSAESDIFNLGPEELGPGLTERLDSSTVVNAQVGYRFKQFQLTAYVTNVFDEDAPENINLASAGIFATPPVYALQGLYTLRPPRVVGLTLDMVF